MPLTPLASTWGRSGIRVGVVGVARSSPPSSAAAASPSPPAATPAPAASWRWAAPRLSSLRHLDSNALSTDLGAVEFFNGFIRFVLIVHGHKSKPWRLPCYPDVYHPAELLKLLLQLISLDWTLFGQVANVEPRRRHGLARKRRVD